MDDFLEGLENLASIADAVSKGFEFANKALSGASGTNTSSESNSQAEINTITISIDEAHKLGLLDNEREEIVDIIEI